MRREVKAERSCRRFLGSALALVIAVAGCGGDDSSSSTPTTALTTSSSPPTSTATSTTGASTASSTGGRATATTGVRATSTTIPSATSTTMALTTTTTAAPRTPASALGFGAVAFTIGTAPQRCALLAETDQQHARGLMGRRDLAGYDAMIFRFPADTTGAFYMRNVPVALSIAWFTADGTFVSSTDMAPCGDLPDCPTYGPAGPYRYAMEVLQGGLEPLGATPGSVLTVGGACRS